MSMIVTGGGVAAAMAARRRREEERHRRSREEEQRNKAKNQRNHSSVHHHEETKTKILKNGWTVKEIFRDGELSFSQTFDENNCERESKMRFSGYEGEYFRIARYDEQGKLHGEQSTVTVDNQLVLERSFCNHGERNGDGLHFEIRGGMRTEWRYLGGEMIESSEYFINKNAPEYYHFDKDAAKDSKNLLLSRKSRFDDKKGLIYRECYKINPHYYMNEKFQVLKNGESLLQKFNPDKTVALSEKHDKDGNLIEYIVDGQDKLAEKLEEIKREKLASEQRKKEMEEAKSKRIQARKAKEKAVMENALSIRHKGRGMVAVLKRLRNAGLLETATHKSKKNSGRR